MNELNIEIFDYIFCKNAINDAENDSKYADELNNMIKEKFHMETNYDFWNEYKYYINPNTLKDISTLSGLVYGYFNFPKLTMDSKISYLNYKINQFKRIINQNPNYDFSNFGNDLNLSNDKAIKEVLDYFIRNNIIKTTGKYYDKSILDIYEFNYDKIEVNLDMNEKRKEKIIVQEINNYGNMSNSLNGNASLNINQNSEELFKMVMDKIKVMEAEQVPQEQINKIIEGCNNKDFNKVTKILKEIGIAGLSMVANGILAHFGINI